MPAPRRLATDTAFENRPSTTPASNFDRYDYWLRILDRIKTHFADQVVRENRAVVVRKLSDTDDRSMGVNRLLVNYHLLDNEAKARVLANPDQGTQKNTEAWRHIVDEQTVDQNRIEILSTNEYQYYEESINAVTEFSKLGLMPIGQPEFMLGSRNLKAREAPHSKVWVYLVGAIDMFLYNRNTGRLVIAEVKGNQDNNRESSAASPARFLSMKQLFMKEKHCMQVTMYAVMLIAMSREAGVEISPDDIELILFANSRAKRTSIVWTLKYRPLTFLGRHWAPNRWYGLLDTQSMKFGHELGTPRPQKRSTEQPPPLQSFRKCHLCGSTERLGRTRHKPIQIICEKCDATRRCDCGRLLRNTTRKYCSPQCPRLKTGVVQIMGVGKNIRKYIKF